VHGNIGIVSDANLLITCSKASAKASAAQQHRPFKCDQCSKSFRNKSGLSNHRIIHNGQKPHKCSFKGCGKSFARSCDLTRHTRLHTGDKPFKCKYNGCGKQFTRSVQLRLHMMDHTGLRPYNCNVCKKGFKTLQNAQIHMRIHTGEKPYECKHCHKRFTQSSSLKTHLTSIHADKWWHTCYMYVCVLYIFPFLYCMEYKEFCRWVLIECCLFLPPFTFLILLFYNNLLSSPISFSILCSILL